MRKRSTICFFLLLLSLAQLHGQNKDKEIPFRMSARASACIPHSLSNKAFRRSFTGIYDITTHVDFQILRGFVAILEPDHEAAQDLEIDVRGDVVNTGEAAAEGFI